MVEAEGEAGEMAVSIGMAESVERVTEEVMERGFQPDLDTAVDEMEY